MNKKLLLATATTEGETWLPTRLTIAMWTGAFDHYGYDNKKHGAIDPPNPDIRYIYFTNKKWQLITQADFIYEGETYRNGDIITPDKALYKWTTMVGQTVTIYIED